MGRHEIACHIDGQLAWFHERRSEVAQQQQRECTQHFNLAAAFETALSKSQCTKLQAEKCKLELNTFLQCFLSNGYYCLVSLVFKCCVANVDIANVKHVFLVLSIGGYFVCRCCVPNLNVGCDVSSKYFHTSTSRLPCSFIHSHVAVLGIQGSLCKQEAAGKEADRDPLHQRPLYSLNASTSALRFTA